jgi:hypothetical protein
MASSPPLNSGANGYVGIHHIGFWVDDLVANGRRANSRPVEIEMHMQILKPSSSSPMRFSTKIRTLSK